MSILIKGLDVTALNDDSSVCYKDIRIFANGSATTSSGEHPYFKTFEWVDVPTPHGDLIDREEHKRFLENKIGRCLELQDHIAWLNEQPTVIESEE